MCNELHPHIARQRTHLRQTICVEQRVAVIIWKLDSTIEYRMLAGMFGIGRSTACELVNDTAKLIVTHLLPKYVKIPNGDRLKEIVKGFELLLGFPQAAGAIDGTHIPIICPQYSSADYYN